MRTIRTCCLLCSWLILTSGASHAGDKPAAAENRPADLTELSLEELMKIPVRAASGFEQLLSEAPSSVSILTADDLRSFGYRTLADALASVAGFYSTYDRTYNYLGVRGFNRPGDYNTRTLVLINGVRVNDPAYNTGRIGMELPLDLDLIDRIEIVRGPSSSLYGSSAFFAVINIVTRGAKSLAPAEVSATAGSYNAFSGRISLARVFGEKGSILISGSLLNSEGDDIYFPAFDSPQSNNGVARNIDGDLAGSLFMQARYGNFTFQANHVDRCKKRPTASFGTIFNDRDAEDHDRETIADLTWEGDLATDLQGMARVGYQHYEYGASWPYDLANPGEPPYRIIGRDVVKSDMLSSEIRFTTQIIPRNKVTAGTEFRNAFRLDQGYVSEGESILDSRESQWECGVYAQDEIHLYKGTLLNAGLRYDIMEPYSDSDWSPRIALIMTPYVDSTFKLIYGKAFRAPNAYERFYDDGGIAMKANPELNPETIGTYEFIWEQRIVEWLLLSTSLYRYKIDHLITQVVDPSDGLLQYQNINSVNASGGEIEARARIPWGLELRSSYAYCEAEDNDTGDRLSNSPKHIAKLNLITPVVSNRLKAGIEVQYISDRLTVKRDDVEDYVLVNATLLAHRPAGNLDISLSVYNIFNQDYEDPVGEEITGSTITQDGRTLRLKAIYHF